MNRTTWILTALLAASLAWAYGSTTRAPVTGARETGEFVWKGPADAITKIEYRAGPTRVTLSATPRKSGTGRFLWVEGEGMISPPPPARKRGKRPAPPPPPEQPTADSFQGNAQAQRFVEELANLQAVRVLGTAKGLKLEDYGLAGEGEGSVTVERQGGAPPLRLILGATGAGNATRYALSTTDNRVVLVRNTIFRSFTNVRRFMERDLFPFPVQEAQRIEVQGGDRRLTLFRVDVPNTEPNRWARTAKDKTGDPALQEVANGLQRMKSLHYLQGAPDLEKSTPALTVTLTKGSDAPVTLRIYAERQNEAPAASTHTERPVALSAALVKTLLERFRAAAK